MNFAGASTSVTGNWTVPYNENIYTGATYEN